GRAVQVYFVSASPPQIGKAIRDKLALDGVPYDGIVFKNQLQHLRPGKLHNLREHVGFKLAELLRGRLAAPLESRELLFGDDWESDSLIYSLYADVLAGRLAGPALDSILRRIRVDPALVSEILALAARAAGREAVDRIFINLERRTPPATFRLFGVRLVPIFNYFQAAAVLAVDGHLEGDHVSRVGEGPPTAAGAGAAAGQLARRRGAPWSSRPGAGRGAGGAAARRRSPAGGRALGTKPLAPGARCARPARHPVTAEGPAAGAGRARSARLPRDPRPATPGRWAARRVCREGGSMKAVEEQ